MKPTEKPNSVEGTFRVFGEIGPPYQVLSVDIAKGVAEILLLETSESVKVPLSAVEKDPIKK